MTAPPKRKEEGMRVGLNQAQMTLLHAVQHSKEPYRLTAMDMVDELMQPLSWLHCSKHVMSVGTERYRHKHSSSSVIKGGLGPGEERNTHQWEFYLQCCPTNTTRGTKGNVTRNERQNITFGTFIVNARKTNSIPLDEQLKSEGIYLSKLLALESRWENGRTTLNSVGMVTSELVCDPAAPVAWDVE